MGDPEDALFTANSLRSGVINSAEQHGLRLRLGINLGPVRVVSDINGHSNVLGDGINVAQRVMSFAEPDQISSPAPTMRSCRGSPPTTPSSFSTWAFTTTSMCASTRSMRCTWPCRLTA